MLTNYKKILVLEDNLILIFLLKDNIGLYVNVLGECTNYNWVFSSVVGVHVLLMF